MAWKSFAYFMLLGMLILSSCTPPTSAPVVEFEPTEEATSEIEARPQPTATAQPVRVERDIEFVAGGGAYQSLDVYLPSEGEGPFPSILAIHGGAFRARSKGLYHFLGNYFAEKGYAFVPTNYRLIQKATYPAQVEDPFCALAWIHANQELYGFDPEQVYVWGGSAGAYLAGMLGTVETPESFLENCPYDLPESTWLQGMILFYGFYDFTDPENMDGFPDHGASLEDLWGATYDELSQETLAMMSPMSWVDGGEPPTLLLHGTDDTTVPSWMSEQFAAALADAGVEVELLLLEGVKHGFEIHPLDGPEMTRALAAIEQFLAEVNTQ